MAIFRMPQGLNQYPMNGIETQRDVNREEITSKVIVSCVI